MSPIIIWFISLHEEVNPLSVTLSSLLVQRVMRHCERLDAEPSPLVGTGPVLLSVHLSAVFLANLLCPESILVESRGAVGGVMGLAATVPPGVRLPPQRVLHLMELHAGHRDGGLPFLLEAGLEVERHQEVLADQQGSAEARHAAQVLQVAPQQDGALALLAAVAVHGEHMDVHSRGVWDMLSHGLLQSRG